MNRMPDDWDRGLLDTQSGTGMKTCEEEHHLAWDKEDCALYLEYSIPDLPTTINSDPMSLAKGVC